MADLIDRDKLIKAIVNTECTIETYNYVISGTEAYHNGLAQRQLEILDIIREQPTVDTERHAHWEKGYYTEQGRTTEFFYCSHCLGTHNFESKYCEDCGCIMDEVTNNDG